MKRPSLATNADKTEMAQAARNSFKNRGIPFTETLSECGISIQINAQTVLSIDWCLPKSIAVVINHLSNETQEIISDSGKSTVPAQVAGNVIEKMAERA